METKYQEMIAELGLEQDPVKAIEIIQLIYKEPKHPVVLYMWAYYAACRWLETIDALEASEQHIVRFKNGNIHDRTPVEERELNRCTRIFKGTKREFELLLLSRRHEVYYEFRHVPARLDMSHNTFHEEYCKMLFCVNELFMEHNDTKCQRYLQDAGFMVDALLLAPDWDKNKVELYLEINSRVNRSMSCMAMAMAFYAVDSWVQLLSADDPVTCELFGGFSDDIRQLHKKLMWKIIKDNDFPHFVADYWLRDNNHFNATKFEIKVGGYKMTINRINATMVEYIPSSPFNIEQVEIDDIINTAINLRENA
jgi:hypothetical protein